MISTHFIGDFFLPSEAKKFSSFPRQMSTESKQPESAIDKIPRGQWNEASPPTFPPGNRSMTLLRLFGDCWYQAWALAEQQTGPLLAQCPAFPEAVFILNTIWFSLATGGLGLGVHTEDAGGSLDCMPFLLASVRVRRSVTTLVMEILLANAPLAWKGGPAYRDS